MGLLMHILNTLGFKNQTFIKVDYDYLEALPGLEENLFDIYGSYFLGADDFAEVINTHPNSSKFRFKSVGTDQTVFHLASHLYKPANSSFIRHLLHFRIVSAMAALYLAVKYLKVRLGLQRNFASWSFWLIFGGLCSVVANVLTVFIASGPTLLPPFRSIFELEAAVRSGRCTLLIPYPVTRDILQRYLASFPPAFVHWDRYTVQSVNNDMDEYIRRLLDPTKV